MIGAAIDLTKNMAPFDAPALEAAQIEIKKINAAGGVNGRPLEIKPLNDQLDPARTKSDATQLVSEGVNIGWVTCDVDYATPAIQTFLAAKLLTVSPCIGTDQMGPSKFGAAGDLAFTFGNPAQQDGAARPSGPTSTVGTRRTSSPTSCSCTSRTCARRSRCASSSSAARSSTRSPSPRAIRRSATSRRGSTARRRASSRSAPRSAPTSRRSSTAYGRSATRRRSSMGGRATAPTGGRRTRRSPTSTSSPTRLR